MATEPLKEVVGIASRWVMPTPIPPIAVVIPTYNHAHYLYRAVASALWQLGPYDELIVVDDGSTDARGFEKLEPFRNRILWLSNSTRRGVSCARNRAIERSRADWIKFLDADDVLAPFALDVLRNALEKMPSSIQVVTGGCHRLVDGIYHGYLAGSLESLDSILKQNPILPNLGVGSVLDIDIFVEGGNLKHKARKLRVEYPGAVYHVMNRGERREAETAVTAKWIAERLKMGAPGYVDHLLYHQRTIAMKRIC